MLKPRKDQRRKKKCSQWRKVGRVMLPFLSLWGRKNRSIWGGSFCSIEEVVRKGKKDTSWIPGLLTQGRWPERGGFLTSLFSHVIARNGFLRLELPT